MTCRFKNAFLVQGILLLCLMLNVNAQWVAFSKGQVTPPSNYFNPWNPWSQTLGNVRNGGYYAVPTYDIRSGDTTIRLSQDDIWHRPSKTDGASDNAYAHIAMENARTWNFVTHRYEGPRWIPDGIWGYRAIYKDGSAVINNGIPIAASLVPNPSTEHEQYFTRIIALDELTEDEIFFELLDQAGEAICKFRVIIPECAPCKSEACAVRAGIGSVDYEIPIGMSSPIGLQQGRPCFLRFYQEEVTLIGSESISLIAPVSGAYNFQKTYDANGNLETVTVGNTFTKIEQFGDENTPISIKITVSHDWQNPETTVYRTVTISNHVDTNNSPYLEFEDLVNGTSKVTTFRESAEGEWTLDTENGARRTTRSVTESEDERIVRNIVEERISISPDVYEVVSDESTVYLPGPHGWLKSASIIDPDGLALKTVTTFYQDGEDTSPDGSESSAGLGRLKMIQHPNGEIERHYYVDNPAGSFFDFAHTVKSAFAGAQEDRETVTETVTGVSPETGRELIVKRVTEKVAGLTISKMETSREDVIAPGFSGYITETRLYSSPTEFTSTFTFESRGNDQSITVINPDGTANISSRVVNLTTEYTTSTNGNGYVHTDPATGIPQVMLVNMSETITDKHGEEITSSTYRFKNGQQILVSRKVATQFDSQHRATRFEHFVEGNDDPVFVTEREYGCCGLIRERDEQGIDTHYAYDELQRVVLTNRAGVTTQTVRSGLTTSQHRYAQTIPSGGQLSLPGWADASNEISRSVRNLVGDTLETWNRSPQDGTLVKSTFATSYNLGGGIGRRVVITPPADDDGVTPSRTDEFFLDGSAAISIGNLGPNRGYRYAATTIGTTVESFLLDGTTEKENTISQSDWVGRQTRITYTSDLAGTGGNDHAEFFYNSKGQLSKSVDPDGVTTLYGYNLRGEQTTTALDLNGNGEIDLVSDRVSFTETDLAQRPGGEWVMRTTRRVWIDPGSAQGTTTSYNDASLDGLRSWSIANPTLQAGETRSVTTLEGSGIVTQILIWPDHTSQTTTLVNGLATIVAEKDADGQLLHQTETGYDSLNRVHTLTDSRSGTFTQHYLNDTTDVVNRILDNLNRETLYTYDHRGRQKTTDLPDTVDEDNNPVANITVTHHFTDGNIQEQTGDGTYRTTWTYDYAGRPDTMTTYGTETAVTRWVYDASRGFLTGKLYDSPTPGTGIGPSYTYTAAGRLKTRTQARLVNGSPLVTTYTYGTATGSSLADLDQVSHSDGTPGYTITTRDRLGRAGELQDAAGTRAFEFTRHGNLKSETYTAGILAGQKIEQDFDSLLRARSHTASFDAQSLGTTAYRYGPSGAIREVSGHGQSATYHYHPTKRVLERITYAEAGQSTQWLESTRQHDAANRLTRITTHVDDAGVFKAVDHHAYGYDALDRVASHRDMTGATWNYRYNARGEVGKAVKTLPGGSTEINGRAYHYQYDGIGNRTSVEQSRDSGQVNRTFGYTPNALNQYSTMTHPSFVDVAGTAAESATVTVNNEATTRQGGYFRKELTGDNSSTPQWLEAEITDGTTTSDGSLPLPPASVTPIHDDDGNLEFDGLWNYTWDAENRLVQVERSAAMVTAGAPYLKLEYDYDSQGRRIRSSTFTSSGATTPTSQTLYVFVGWKCVAELDALSGNQAIRKYTWGLDLAGDIGDSSTGNVGALLWLVDTATTTTHVHLYSRLGNVTGLVNATNRQKSATYEYDAFGQLTVCYGDYAKKNPFTFSTKYTDFSTGLCYYGYRWYSPKAGRWINWDPIEEDGGINLYGFVENDGISNIDILGLSSYVIVFDGNDPNRLFQQWSRSLAKMIKCGECESMFGNAIGANFDPKNDKIITINASESDWIEKLKNLKDISYLASLGHGNNTEIWYNHKGNESSNVIHMNRPGTTLNSNYVSVSNFPDLDFLPNAYIELYHCNTAIGELSGQKSIREAFAEKFKIDVYGASHGVSSTHMSRLFTLDGWLGNLRPGHNYDLTPEQIRIKTPARDKFSN